MPTTTKRKTIKPRKRRRRPVRPHDSGVEREPEPELLPGWTRNVTAAPEPPLGESHTRGIEVVAPGRNGKPQLWRLRWNDPGTGEPLQMDAAETEQATEKIAADLRAVLRFEWAIADGIDPADLDADADGDE